METIKQKKEPDLCDISLRNRWMRTEHPTLLIVTKRLVVVFAGRLVGDGTEERMQSKVSQWRCSILEQYFKEHLKEGDIGFKLKDHRRR